MNWKTTIAGVLTGLVPIIEGLSSSLQQGAPVHWTSLLLGFGIMTLGVLSKDAPPKKGSNQ